MSGPFTVILADDHAVVRQGLRLLLERAGMDVVAEAANAREAMAQTEALRPSVLVLDLHMPGGSSLEAITWLRAHVPGTAVVILTMQDDPAFARQALHAGALAYVLKEAAEEELLDAIRLASAGRPYLSPRVGAHLAATPEPVELSPAELTAREFEVLRLVALGHTNDEIARQLYVSTRTVETHRAQVQKKIGRSSRAQLVRYALDHNLLSV
jgi:two-component system response regulator NreC